MTSFVIERGATRDMPAYLQIVRSRLKLARVYRQAAFFLLAVVVVQIFVLREVWGSLYGTQSSMNGLSKHALLVYLTIANLQGWVLQDPTVSRYMYERVRQGVVAFDLIRPTGFIPQAFAHIVGSALASLVFVLLALPIVAFAGRLDAPASAAAAGYYAVSLLCAYVVAGAITLIIGLVAFWSSEIQGLTMLYRLVSQFFAGALVPLAFFPTGLRVLAQALPFQSTVYTPVAIYVGKLHGSAAIEAIGVQLVWAVVLCLCAWAMWRRALFRVVVQGG